MQVMKGRSGGFTSSLVASGAFVIAAACLIPFMKEKARGKIGSGAEGA